MRSIFPETLAPPNTATNGRWGVIEGAAEILQLLFHQEPGHRGLEQLGDCLGAGMGPVCGAEGIVHVQVTESPAKTWASSGSFFSSPG